jgi:hypothetical protein
MSSADALHQQQPVLLFQQLATQQRKTAMALPASSDSS